MKPFWQIPLLGGLLMMLTCTVAQAQDQQTAPGMQLPLSFILFGDSGYHLAYRKGPIRNDPQSMDDYLADKRRSWLKKGLPAADFTPPPACHSDSTHVTECTGLYAVVNAMTHFCQTETCALGLMMGDNIYPSGADGSAADKARFRDILDEPFRPLLNSAGGFRIYAMLGNHDWQTSRAGRDAQVGWFNAAENPQMVLPEPGFYSFWRGDAEFFVLDTNLLLAGTSVIKDQLNADGSEKKHSRTETPPSWRMPQGKEKNQLKWLQQSLSSSTARWKIVAGHHPLWSSGGSKFEEARALRKLLMPMLCEYADMYLAGHEHDLEIHTDQCGPGQLPLPLIVSGAAAKQRPVHTPFQQYQQQTYPQYREVWLQGMVWGFTHIELDQDQAQVTMLTTPNDQSGTVTEAFKVSFPRRH